MNSIHISTARLILNRPDPVDISIWTAKGEVQTWRNCICIKYDHYRGIRKFKLLSSNQIRATHECCIFQLNGMEVFLWLPYRSQKQIFVWNHLCFKRFSYLCSVKNVWQRPALSYCKSQGRCRLLIGKRSWRASVLCTWIWKIQLMYKTEYEGSRIYVGLSSHSLYITAFQSLGTEIMGYASPLFVSLRQ